MRITIPPSLANRLEGLNEIAVEASTLFDVTSEIYNKYPKLYHLLFTKKGTLNGFVNFYLNYECVTHELLRSMPVNDADLLEIVVSVSGG